MYNLLIWGTGLEYNRYFNCIKLLELKEQISIVAITSNDNINKSIDGYPFVSKKDIPTINFDYCIVAMRNLSYMISEAENLGIERSKLIPIQVLSIPNIDFNEYIKLKNSHLSIFSHGCWAGFCYHRLGLEFLSPTINLFQSVEDFNKLMSDLDTYMSYPVEFAGIGFDTYQNREYPIGRLNDILLHFNHYDNFNQAVTCWERRKKRINKNNIWVVSSSDSEKELHEFEDLPYKKKIIFTSLDIHTPSSFHLDLFDNLPIGMRANITVKANGTDIDLISLLNLKDNYSRIK